MNRHRADTIVGVLLGVILIGGGALSLQAYQQRRALDQSMGSMMDTSIGAMHGPNPLWYLFGTVVVAAAIGGSYPLVRGNVPVSDEDNDTADVDLGLSPTGTTEPTRTTEPTGTTEPTESEDQFEGPTNPETDPQARVLDPLPDDERRVLEPVLSSPGITQIELRDRSDFSKSKVSQTVSELEKRGLLYRERQGRTYRIYPSDDLQHQSP
ncbi:MAG: MarR family transcriptional regulator [Halolamina sp.]